MPHVIYLHSALTQQRIVGRNAAERKQILGFEKVDVVIALSLAGLVNLSMMIVAAALFHSSGLTGVDTIDGAYDGLQAARLRPGGDDLRHRPARLRLRLLLGRDDGGSGGDAGLHPPPDPALRCGAR